MFLLHTLIDQHLNYFLNHLIFKNISNSKESKSTIQLETIGRFKGLEADILILWGLEGLDIDRDRELFYVASSRAKSRLFIVGDEHTCVHIKSNNS